jgi:hypothetical protein
MHPPCTYYGIYSQRITSRRSTYWKLRATPQLPRFFDNPKFNIEPELLKFDGTEEMSRNYLASLIPSRMSQSQARNSSRSRNSRRKHYVIMYTTTRIDQSFLEVPVVTPTDPPTSSDDMSSNSSNDRLTSAKNIPKPERKSIIE